jgi:hypothetical protein
MSGNRTVTKICLSGFVLALMLSGPAFAQGGGMTAAPAVPASGGHPTFKVVAENDKVTVQAHVLFTRCT